MTLLRAAGLIITLGLAACVPRSVTSPPPPAPRPVQAPPPGPVQPPAPVPSLAWADAPLSPGSWVYRLRRGSPAAEFGSSGNTSFVIACGPGRRVLLERVGAVSGSTLTVRTSSEARSLAGALQSGPPAALVAEISSTDPLLDAISFSRGRFAVEAPGLSQLVVPAWPEVARVVDDCRR